MENKMLLMQCAKELFYAKGYDAVGVQEIVDRAGLTKPTLYYYFGSKLGLLKTLLETKLQEFDLLVEESMKMDQDIRATLYWLAKTYCNFFDKDREFYMLMMALFYSARENEAYQAIKPYVTAFYDNVVEAFENASDQLGNMNGRQRQFAIGFTGTINHFLLLQCEADPEHKKEISEQQIINLVNQFMYGIFT
ncbi:MAG: helix-turn-helix domain-containing protein [Candidatus Choladocola sp.]|nr:helix-turn-helix domain-containing protein [Candidatus Choladocola sp.]